MFLEIVAKEEKTPSLVVSGRQGKLLLNKRTHRMILALLWSNLNREKYTFQTEVPMGAVSIQPTAVSGPFRRMTFLGEGAEQCPGSGFIWLGVIRTI